MGKTVFIDGDPSQGVLGTVVPAEWLNKVFNHRHDGLDEDGSAPVDPLVMAISSDTTLYVATAGNDTTGDGSSGAPWATIGKALDYLKNKWINSDVTVTIQLADGTYTLSSMITVDHPCGCRINIVGANTYSKTLSSVVSTSGSTGNWSYVLQLDSTANSAVGDHVIIKSVSGGTYPLLCAGLFRVTAVNGGANQITVASSAATSAAPSGAVTGTCTVIKTMLVWNADVSGLQVQYGNLGLLDKIILVGNSNSNNTINGLVATNGGTVQCGGSVGVRNWYAGFFAVNNGTLIAESAAASGCFSGYRADFGGNVTANFSIANGQVGADSPGFQAINGGVLSASTSISVANAGSGYKAHNNGTIYCTYGQASINAGHGVFATNGGYVAASVISVTSNGGNGIHSDFMSKADVPSVTSTGNGGWGIYASRDSSVNVNSATNVSGNVAGSYSPALNTSGNYNSYINNN